MTDRPFSPETAELIAKLQYEAGMYKSLYETAMARSSEGSADVQEAIRLLNKIVDLAYDEDVGEPLDDAIGYAKEALAALSLSRPDRGVWQQKCPETGKPCDCFKVQLCKLSSQERQT